MSALFWPAVILAFILLGCAASVWAICTKSPSDDEIRVPMREDYWPADFDYRPEGEAWDRHVNDALAMAETPDLDVEWQRFNGGAS